MHQGFGIRGPEIYPGKMARQHLLTMRLNRSLDCLILQQDDELSFDGFRPHNYPFGHVPHDQVSGCA